MEDVLKIWLEADAVCLDVDSTTIQEEGIDELAKFCGKGDVVANLTSQAMSGEMTFQQALKLRLDVIKPSLDQLEEFIETKPPTLTPGVKDLVELLHKRNVPVYLISGGFRRIVEPIAKQLMIPEKNIFANRLIFACTGEYLGFDFSEPTSKSGGKGVVVNTLKKQYGYKNLVIIGDGITDFEASPPADAFIGFGGVVIRNEVKNKAKWYITTFSELIQVYNK